jgi:hypothetical protein
LPPINVRIKLKISYLRLHILDSDSLFKDVVFPYQSFLLGALVLSLLIRIEAFYMQIQIRVMNCYL